MSVNGYENKHYCTNTIGVVLKVDGIDVKFLYKIFEVLTTCGLRSAVWYSATAHKYFYTGVSFGV